MIGSGVDDSDLVSGPPLGLGRFNGGPGTLGDHAAP